MSSVQTQAPDLSRDPVPVPGLRMSEARLIGMLRLWQAGPEGQERVWNDLCIALGGGRARMCLTAFEDVLRLLRQHGWRSSVVLAPGATRLSADERSLAGFVLMATEADRESALMQATFVVRPAGLLPLLTAAARLGLPLLCEESRCRLSGVIRDA